MFSETATGDTPDEQPGAMPEIFPSPDQGPNIDRCWTCRSMFVQAWGNYGTAWAVVHQWLGVQPQLGRGEIAIVPQVPSGQESATGRNIRLGKGSVDVTASHTGSRYTTEIDVQVGGRVKNVAMGHTLPREAEDRLGLPGRRTDLGLRDSSDEPRPRGDCADGPGSTRSRDQHGWLAQSAVLGWVI